MVAVWCLRQEIKQPSFFSISCSRARLAVRVTFADGSCMDTSDSSNNEVASAEEPSSLEEKPEDPSSGSESDTSSDNGGQQPHKFGISTRHDEFLLEDFESDDDLKQNASDKYIELWDPISEFESQKREFNLVEREFMALWSTWTVEEQRKFISALGRFGKYSAHLIASKIATKSTVQVGMMISYFERLSECSCRCCPNSSQNGV
jgi:hypothetical protein